MSECVNLHLAETCVMIFQKTEIFVLKNSLKLTTEKFESNTLNNFIICIAQNLN